METSPRSAPPSASANPTPDTTKENTVSNASTSDVSAVAGSSASTPSPSPGTKPDGKEVTKKKRHVGPKFHPEHDSQKARRAIVRAAQASDDAEVQAASHKLERGVAHLHQASEVIVSATAHVGKAEAELALSKPAIVQALKVVKVLMREVVTGGRNFLRMWTVKDDFRTAKAYVDHMESNDAGLDAQVAAKLREAVAAAQPASDKVHAAKASLERAKAAYVELRGTLATDTQVLNSLAALHRARAKQKLGAPPVRGVRKVRPHKAA